MNIKQKTNLARLYIDQKAAGKTRKEFPAEMARAGWEFSERQLDRWAARIKLINIERRTASNYLKEDGFTYRVLQKKVGQLQRRR